MTLSTSEERNQYNKLFNTVYIKDSYHLKMFDKPDHFNSDLRSVLTILGRISGMNLRKKYQEK